MKIKRFLAQFLLKQCKSMNESARQKASTGLANVVVGRGVGRACRNDLPCNSGPAVLRHGRLTGARRAIRCRRRRGHFDDGVKMKKDNGGNR